MTASSIPQGAPTPAESLDLEEFRSQFQDSCFPILRGTVVQVMRAAADPDTSQKDLVQLLSGDPGLCIQVLRFANSAAFQLETEVTSIGRALSVIGTRALRNIAICFAACEATPPDAVGNFSVPKFLEQSVRRGASAELIASAMGFHDPEEAFTASLLQDFGVVAMIMHHPTLSAEWMSVAEDTHEHRREFERATFGSAHDDISDELAQRWQLPSSLAEVMRWHHRPERCVGSENHMLVRVANLAEFVADVFTASDKAAALTLATERLSAELGLTEEEAHGLIERVPKRVEMYASAMGVEVQPQTSLSSVVDEMRDQNRLLVEMNLSYQQETWKLEQILREKEEVERELRLAKARLERLAMTDALTMLPNRRHFEQSLESELSRAQRQGGGISVVICDVDHFKSLNDTYGHPFGDMVLRMLASALRGAVRNTDMVARIGGEEFAVLLPSADKRAGIGIGERLRRAVEDMVVMCNDKRVKVTSSFGGCTASRVDAAVSAPKAGWMMVQEADQALYAAKRSGRNRVAWKPKPVDLAASGASKR